MDSLIGASGKTNGRSQNELRSSEAVTHVRLHPSIVGHLFFVLRR
jgi:hypothetical protein